VKNPIVSDSTCLIGLERIGHLDILPALYRTVTVPPEVEREFGALFPWLEVEAPGNKALVTALTAYVDTAEAEAIVLASERGCQVILDDRRARHVAARMGVSLIGTVGVLVRAKGSGILPSLSPLLDKLESNGFYISRSLKQEALRLAGESGRASPKA